MSEFARFDEGDEVIFDPPTDEEYTYSYDRGRSIKILGVVDDDDDIIDAENPEGNSSEVWYEVKFLDTGEESEMIGTHLSRPE